MAEVDQDIKLPRVAITYCTQCKWMLRAAYFGQELLSTFSTDIGEIALIPATGGLFQVNLTYRPESTAPEAQSASTRTVLLWDRKSEGGFPEAKVLKQRLRDHIAPDRNLGHSDKHGRKGEVAAASETRSQKTAQPEERASAADQKDCEDCK